MSRSETGPQADPTEPAGAASGAANRSHEVAARRPGGGRGRRWKIAGVAIAVAGVLTLGACSHGGHRGWGGAGMGAASDPERAVQFAEKMADRLVSRVDGTPEQKQQITGIAQSATRDLMPLREQARAARTRSIELLRAPAIDRAAIEALRIDQIRLADTASRRLTQAVTDVAEVLTPEQREKLADRMAARRGWRS